MDIDSFFTKLYERYAFKLLHWANNRLNNITDAEDLVQETVLQILNQINTQQLDIGIPTEKLDAYVWKVAYYTWCNFLRKDKNQQKLHRDIIHNPKYHIPDQQELITKVRQSITRLNYLHRETMIMFYIEKRPVKEIASLLDIKISYVTKLLTEARQKVVKENKNMKADTEFVYRPHQLYMGVSGKPGDKPDYEIILACVLKQNICIACYETPRNINELSGLLGISKPYIEIELEWLLDKEFIEKRQDKYYTMFFIENHDNSIKIANVYLENKALFIDKLIEKLTERLQAYYRIGFHGADQQIEKLLWFLIFCFIDYTAEKYYTEPPIRLDGGAYHIFGRVHTEPTTAYHPVLTEKYPDFFEGLYFWNVNWEDSGQQIKALGINCPPDENLYKFDINSNDINVINLRNTLMKVLQEDFSMESLSVDEKVNLSELISLGWLTLREEGKGKRECEIVPSFYVFDSKQRKELCNIFEEIHAEMSSEIVSLTDSLKSAIKDILPIQLDFFKDYALYSFLRLGSLYATRLAFLYGKLYKPDNDVEYALLGLNVTVNN